VFQDVEQVATLDMEDDVLEPDAALRPELCVLRIIPVEVLHHSQRITGSSGAQTRSENHRSAANASQVPMDGFSVRAYQADDPECGERTVWLATYEARSPADSGA
jgi:hypothetical protein